MTEPLVMINGMLSPIPDWVVPGSEYYQYLTATTQAQRDEVLQQSKYLYTGSTAQAGWGWDTISQGWAVPAPQLTTPTVKATPVNFWDSAGEWLFGLQPVGPSDTVNNWLRGLNPALLFLMMQGDIDPMMFVLLASMDKGNNLMDWLYHGQQQPQPTAPAPSNSLSQWLGIAPPEQTQLPADSVVSSI